MRTALEGRPCGDPPTLRSATALFVCFRPDLPRAACARVLVYSVPVPPHSRNFLEAVPSFGRLQPQLVLNLDWNRILHCSLAPTPARALSMSQNPGVAAEVCPAVVPPEGAHPVLLPLVEAAARGDHLLVLEHSHVLNELCPEVRGPWPARLGAPHVVVATP
jgi:hypothetical protein